MTATLDGLLDAIANQREDWPRYLVAADAAEEAGVDSHAVCLRWLWRNGKRARIHAGSILWYSEKNAEGVDPASDLPETLFDCLEGQPDNLIDQPWHEYPSPRAALDAVLDAWGWAVRSGWRPEGGA